LATSIGSLPHCDPGEAVDFLLRHQRRFPAAPSLPARSRREGMIAQAAHGVVGITVGDDGKLTIDEDHLDPEAPLTDPGFGSDGFVGLRAFLTAVGDRRGPIKVSLTGPVTLGMALRAAGVPSELAFRVAGRAASERAAALVQYATDRAPEAELVVFVDEPSLAATMHPNFPIAATDAIDLISGTLAPLERRAITGLHCCGAADWRLALQAGPQILSLPVEVEVESAAGAMAAFLDRGGWIAWGAVPTDRPIGTTVDRLWRQLSDRWCQLVTVGGAEPMRLRTQAIITPACGLYRHGVAQAEQVLAFTDRLADRLHDQAIGVRLSVGA
jgi:hypothetical protein